MREREGKDSSSLEVLVRGRLLFLKSSSGEGMRCNKRQQEELLGESKENNIFINHTILLFHGLILHYFRKKLQACKRLMNLLMNQYFFLIEENMTVLHMQK